MKPVPLSRSAARAAALVALAGLSACAAQVPVQPGAVDVGVASFNMAWAGTEADFQSHLAVCKAVEWCDTRPRREKGEKQASPAAVAKARACQASVDREAGGADKAMQIAPCNAYRPKDPEQHETTAAYAEKMAGLRATVDALIEKEGVKVIAFQEVKSQAAVKEVLGKHGAAFDTCDAPHSTFQTLAFAWDRQLGARPGVCSVRSELAVPEDPADASSARRLRPGLALELFVNGAPVTFMNIHLKSSCASLKDNAPYFGRRLTDADGACRVLNRQVPALEDWIEAVAASSPRFMLLGDYNRRIDEEAQETVAPGQVRLDGSDPAGPNPKDAQGYVGSHYLWQEIADGSPLLYQVPLAATAGGCTGFQGLDHMVVSDALKAALAPQAFASRKAAVVSQRGQKIETSDHCPRIMTLKL